MGLKYTNNAQSTLQFAAAASATAIQLVAGAGSIFPVLNSGDFFPVTLIKADGSGYEIALATARSGDIITITRGQEGTSAIALAAGDVVSTRITARFLDEFARSGVTNLSVVKGINYSKSTGTAGSNLYNVTINAITAYEDDLRIDFLAHSSNGASPTSQINVNGLGNRSIVYPDGTALVANAITQNKRIQLHYSAALSAFVIDNAFFPNPTVTIPVASTTTSGTVIRGTEEDLDTNGDNTKYTTQRTVSRMIEDQSNLVFDPTWTNYGRGVTGDLTINTAVTRQSGRSEEFKTLNIGASGVLDFTAKCTVVFRATVEVIISGQIILPDADSPPKASIVGPLGTDAGDGGAVGGNADVVHGTQLPHLGLVGQGGSVPQAALDMVAIQAIDFQLIKGGDGRGAINDVSPAVPTEGCAGLIIIAPKVTFASGCTIDCRSRRGVNGAGHAGGGMIIVASPDLTVDPGADFIAGDGSTAQNATYWDDPANDNENGGAGNAQFFHIDPATKSTSLIF